VRLHRLPGEHTTGHGPRGDPVGAAETDHRPEASLEVEPSHLTGDLGSEMHLPGATSLNASRSEHAPLPDLCRPHLGVVGELERLEAIGVEGHPEPVLEVVSAWGRMRGDQLSLVAAPDPLPVALVATPPGQRAVGQAKRVPVRGSNRGTDLAHSAHLGPSPRDAAAPEGPRGRDRPAIAETQGGADPALERVSGLEDVLAQIGVASGQAGPGHQGPPPPGEEEVRGTPTAPSQSEHLGGSLGLTLPEPEPRPSQRQDPVQIRIPDDARGPVRIDPPGCADAPPHHRQGGRPCLEEGAARRGPPHPDQGAQVRAVRVRAPGEGHPAGRHRGHPGGQGEGLVPGRQGRIAPATLDPDMRNIPAHALPAGDREPPLQRGVVVDLAEPQVVCRTRDHRRAVSREGAIGRVGELLFRVDPRAAPPPPLGVRGDLRLRGLTDVEHVRARSAFGEHVHHRRAAVPQGGDGQCLGTRGLHLDPVGVYHQVALVRSHLNDPGLAALQDPGPGGGLLGGGHQGQEDGEEQRQPAHARCRPHRLHQTL